MRTTINDLVGRRGGASSVDETKDVLDRARELLADITSMLQLETERYFRLEFDTRSRPDLEQIQRLIAQTQKAMQTVLDLEIRTGLARPAGDAKLDLEEARAEILGRLSRLVGRENPEDISGRPPG